MQGKITVVPASTPVASPAAQFAAGQKQLAKDEATLLAPAKLLAQGKPPIPGLTLPGPNPILVGSGAPGSTTPARSTSSAPRPSTSRSAARSPGGSRASTRSPSTRTNTDNDIQTVYKNGDVQINAKAAAPVGGPGEPPKPPTGGTKHAPQLQGRRLAELERQGIPQLGDLRELAAAQHRGLQAHVHPRRDLQVHLHGPRQHEGDDRRRRRLSPARRRTRGLAGAGRVSHRSAPAAERRERRAARPASRPASAGCGGTAHHARPSAPTARREPAARARARAVAAQAALHAHRHLRPTVQPRLGHARQADLPLLRLHALPERLPGDDERHLRRAPPRARRDQAADRGRVRHRRPAPRHARRCSEPGSTTTAARFVGLRGTPTEIAAAEEAAGVPPAPRAPQAARRTTPSRTAASCSPTAPTAAPTSSTRRGSARPTTRTTCRSCSSSCGEHVRSEPDGSDGPERATGRAGPLLAAAP